MARETKEERLVREAQEQADAELALAEYRASIPKRLLEAQVLAQQLGVNVRLGLTATGPTAQFEYESERDKICIDETITYETEQWELEYLEDRLRQIKQIQENQRIRQKLAQDAFDRLSAVEKSVVKEYIHALR